MDEYNKFLPNKNFKEIQDALMSAYFPYFRQPSVGVKDEKTLGCLLTHLLVVEGNIVANDQLNHLVLQPIIKRFSKIYKSINLIRVKVNLYPYQNQQFKSAYHIDQHEDHKVCLLSINTNNGYTEFENGAVFNAVENNALIFDGSLSHRSVSQTDHSSKINININYEAF